MKNMIISKLLKKLDYKKLEYFLFIAFLINKNLKYFLIQIILKNICKFIINLFH